MKQLVLIPAVVLSMSSPAILFAEDQLNYNNNISISGDGEVYLANQATASSANNKLDSAVSTNTVTEGAGTGSIANNQINGSFRDNAGVGSLTQDTGHVSNYQSEVNIQSNLAQTSQVSAATSPNFNTGNTIAVSGNGSVGLAASLNTTSSANKLQSAVLSNDLSASNPTPTAVNSISGGSYDQAAGIYTVNQNTGDANSTGQSINIQSSLAINNGSVAAAPGALATNSSNNSVAVSGLGNASVADSLNQASADSILNADTTGNSYPGSSGNLSNDFDDSFNGSSGIVTASQTSAQAVNTQQAVTIQSNNAKSVPVSDPIYRNSTQNNALSVAAGAITSAGYAHQAFARSSLIAESGPNPASTTTPAPANAYTSVQNGINNSFTAAAGINVLSQGGGHASISQQSATLQTDSVLDATTAAAAAPAIAADATALNSGNSTAAIGQSGTIAFADRLSEAVSANTLQAASTGKVIAETTPQVIRSNSIQDSFTDASGISYASQNAGLENTAQQSLVLQTGNTLDSASDIELALPENTVNESTLSGISATVGADGLVAMANDLSRAAAINNTNSSVSGNQITLASATSYASSNRIVGSYNNSAGITYVSQATGIANTGSQSITIQGNSGY